MSKNLYNTYCKSKLCIEQWTFHSSKEKLEKRFARKFSCDEIYPELSLRCMCVDGFNNFDFLRSFLNVSLELPLSWKPLQKNFIICRQKRHRLFSKRGGCGLGLCWDGILGHQFDKELKFFAQCYSQSFTGGFLKKTRLYSGFKIHTKIRETNKPRVYSWIASYRKEKWG